MDKDKTIQFLFIIKLEDLLQYFADTNWSYLYNIL